MLNSKPIIETQMMPVRLRGHHFLCMLTFRGLGYSAEFTANMASKIGYIKDGAPVILIEGPDDICAGMSKACTHATGHDCRANDILEMDKSARLSVETVLGRNLADMKPIANTELMQLRAAFENGSIRAACTGCSWYEVCDTIVTGRFYGTQLLAVEP